MQYTKVFCKEWFETEDHKTGWDSFDWVDDNGNSVTDDYELHEVTDTDKYDHPTVALFKLINQ